MEAFGGALSDAIVGVIHAEVEADDGQRRRKQPVGDAWEPGKKHAAWQAWKATTLVYKPGKCCLRTKEGFLWSLGHLGAFLHPKKGHFETP